MAIVVREKRRYEDIIKSEHEDDIIIGSLGDKVSSISRHPPVNSPKVQMEQEKRLRREIANSNERRRMQSINAGFQSLRGLLPHHEGEKLSKAAILQQTAEYIYQLEQDKNKLATLNAQLKRQLAATQSGDGTPAGTSYSSPHSPNIENPPTSVKRRKTIDGAVESADEGIGNMSPEHSGSGEDLRSEISELRREAIDLRIQLEREHRHRIGLEEQISLLQQQQQQPPVFSRKFEHDRMQPCEEVESFQRVPTPGRVIQEDAPRCYTIRNNLETIVEAIRHLEGDHLFSDDRNNSTPMSTPPSASSPIRAMEICSSAGSSPSHSHGSAMVEMAPLALTATHSPSLGQLQLPPQQLSGNCFPTATVSTTVTSLKQHVLSRLARSSEIDDQPINLEFRPVISRSPSPIHQQPQSIPVQFQLQQQHLRPGVIVVKHS
ncbi:unnamed protein product [Allacma fusca]|uniref:BHLH domain-containing protein n=1 Tax=Allacma fusca TaxID=39272 RepID=A0A8J2JBY5_9HEXA|nr:unnamed protein product [Allacma fusca]